MTQNSTQRSSTTSSWLKRLARLGGLYVGLCFVLFLVQRNLIFQPQNVSQAAFENSTQAMFGFREVIEPYRAIVLEPQGKAAEKGTAILFHGNSGTVLDREMYVREILSKGFRLVLAEYPGYGPREGKISEEALVADAKELYRTLRNKFPEGPFVVIGESLGSGVAVRVAAESLPSPERLVLITPFDSMTEVVSKKLPVIPTSWLLLDEFSSSTHIAKYRGPVALLIAENDEVVGAAAGKALGEASKLRGPTIEVVLPNAGHNTWFHRATPAHWQALLLGP